jgi:hypothetical protein
LIVSYIRDEEGTPYGCFVSTGRDKIGFSICHPDDEFHKTTARGLALEREVEAEECMCLILDRVVGYEGSTPNVTAMVLVEAMLFRKRVNKYFKLEGWSKF